MESRTEIPNDVLIGSIKLFIFSMTPTMFSALRPSHSHLSLGLSLVAGVLLQALIPPRKKGLVPGLAITVIFTVVYAFL